MLHRSGLLLDTHLLQQQITIHCTDMPWRHRLMASEAICVSSARAVIRLLTEDNIDDHQSRLLLHTLTSLLLSVYVLAIYILKHPQAKTVQSDVLVSTVALYFCSLCRCLSCYHYHPWCRSHPHFWAQTNIAKTGSRSW